MSALEIIFLVWAVMATICAFTFFLQWRESIHVLQRWRVNRSFPPAALGVFVVAVGAYLLWNKYRDRGR